MKKINKLLLYPTVVILFALIFTISCEKENDNTVTDIDGNVYHTVTIGTQVWMVENLKTTRYNDGSSIPLVTENSAWLNLTTPGYCWYNNDQATYKAVYGALYNGYAVNTEKLCPSGWHVPTYAEWTTLIEYVGGQENGGGKLKEVGTTHWDSPNGGATNETGFTALPGGLRSEVFTSLGFSGTWWTSTTSSSGQQFVYINSIYPKVYSGSGIIPLSGYSIRCIKD
jgi:uncharacterized protein (TIGR02145 family)